MKRRQFLESSAAAGLIAALSAASSMKAHAANDRISICMMGVRGRGGGVWSASASLREVEVRYVCDLDPAVLDSRLAQVEQKTGKRPLGIKDFRKALEDKSLDAFVIGTPDHWHALPTIHACQACKDVYVEKPDGHNILEGRTMVAAAKKHGRIVQLGTQSRSGPHLLSGIEYLKTGPAGKG